jgi:hypothetical protein
MKNEEDKYTILLKTRIAIKLRTAATKSPI